MTLAVTMIALVLVGALVSVGFQVGHLEQRTGRNGLYSARALEAAETGIVDVMGRWAVDPGIGSLGVGGSVALASVRMGQRAEYQAAVVRLTERLYLIRSQGRSTDAEGNPLAERLVSSLVRTVPAGIAQLGQRSWMQGW